MALTKCAECGSQLSTHATECPSCGYPLVLSGASLGSTDGYEAFSKAMPGIGSNLALAAMLCGIGGVVMMFLPFFWVAAGLPNVLAIVIGIIATTRIRRGEASGLGMAVTGVATGAVGLVLYLLMWIILQSAVRAALES